ncbi:Yip1 family protein [Thalassovita mangrovi]|uniref:YIP1 family protein n=1 Tax=Thalassovita mangrovi TaxID=2692236 RepID=A0A6L8LDP5_9RHOB|nr:Yip1 family protein [Thalassovita mangrovi]MYM53955.1 YIP1 family protein [Thalassovita mangrovi]
MNLPDPKQLAIDTLRDPRSAARQILELRLDTSLLWTALALIVVLNAILNGVTLPLMVVPDMVPAAFASPWMFAMILGGGIVIGTFILTWIGQMMGGKAQLSDMLALVVWLQGLRLLVQAVVFLLFFAVPMLSDILALVAGLWGIWITVAFIDEAQRFGSIFKAIMVLVASMLGIAIGLSFFLLLIGASSVGMS